MVVGYDAITAVLRDPGFRPHQLDSTRTSLAGGRIRWLAYFTALAARRRADPHDDLLSDLLAVSDSDDGRLTGAELLHNLTLLLVAGFDPEPHTRRSLLPGLADSGAHIWVICVRPLALSAAELTLGHAE